MPKRVIRVALAFDHELSLGGARSYDENLFDPTQRLFELADGLNVPLVLFTDVCCAIKHEEWDVNGFTQPYQAQLQQAIRLGHDVQLHLHPHWLDSQWNDGTFLPSRSFSLADFADASAPNDIEGIVARGVAYLTRVCGAVRADYRPIAFRAGGYNIAPQTGTIMRALYNNGIRIDSSITPGFYFASDISTIDFRRTPRLPNWFVPLDGPADAHAPHGMYEVPIPSSPRTPVNNVPFLLRRVVHRKRAFNSGGRGIHQGNESRVQKLKRLFPNSAWQVSFDNAADSGRDVFEIFRRYVAAQPRDVSFSCATVSHPKSMGPHARAVMSEFVTRCRDRYGDEVEFVTFEEIAARELQRAPAYT